ncbi:hypothetical protein CfE428DRAFT_6386 [Chthoniobacter flavus Ellin428]|uniref:Uncharacterized protein n=1 Tax=Chthoniobacter flavus Ellin428 TaxID=497964 RepID=B4DBU5_9BACT|nr:hypothetical protein CfE428DRAFT_6386 [Chthoniobacter flavus Ellin428]
MRAKKNQAEPATAKGRKISPRERPRANDASIAVRPAFCAFTLEDEWHGRRRLRGLGKSLDVAKFAPNASGETFSIYRAALGDGEPKLYAKWFTCVNQVGEIVHREKYVRPTQEQATRDLLNIAKDATALLAELLNRQPELCKSIAASMSEWPVLVDRTSERSLTRSTTAC